MFERYTEQARRVLFFARYEASEFGSLSINSEHLLLGLMRESKGLMSRLFAQPDLSLDSIRKEIEDRVAVREKVATSVEMPFSDESNRILQFAKEESDRLLHSYIGAEHLLLGILREERSLAGTILMEKGLRQDAMRQQFVTLLMNTRLSEGTLRLRSQTGRQLFARRREKSQRSDRRARHKSN